jgi:sugar/nucleoside kinase (ribokinase family)
MMKFLAIFGHLNIDVKIGVNSLPRPGEARGVTGLEEQFAGTAGNFAYVAHSLGLEFDLYSVVGKSSHSEYVKRFREIGISTEHVDIVPDKTGPICYIPSDGKEQIAYMFQGPMEGWEPSKYFQYGNYKHIDIGTGPVEEYKKILEREKNASVTFDPGQEIWYTYSPENARFMVEHSQMLIMNKKEFGYLKELTSMEESEIINKIKNVIITDGSNGATLMDHGSYSVIPAFKAHNIKDTVGAGDSFRAGLYTALYRGLDLKKSVMFANITAALAIENRISEFHMTFDGVYDMLSTINA